jgi:hypothetical protein
MKVREQQKAATGFHKQKEAKPSPQIEKQLTMGRMAPESIILHLLESKSCFPAHIGTQSSMLPATT